MPSDPHPPTDIEAWAPYQHIERACELLAQAEEASPSSLTLHLLALSDTHLNVANAKMTGNRRA